MALPDPVSVAVNPKELSKIIRSSTGLNTIFTLAIAYGESTRSGGGRPVDPIMGLLPRADLKRIDSTKASASPSRYTPKASLPA
jgi:hypothetical protein